MAGAAIGSKPPVSDSAIDRQAQAMRRFNRFYTRRIGVLDEGVLESAFSLSETRVLYELAHRDDVTAAVLARDLGLDSGYLSRMLARFRSDGLLQATPSADDARQMQLALTAAGRAAFAPLDARSQAQAVAMLADLDPGTRRRLLRAMRSIEGILGEAPTSPWLIRPHRPGDIGWIVAIHGRLYAQEYGWDQSFEALVAEIAGKFLRDFDPACEGCWIAERDDEAIGSVMVVKKSAAEAQLRLLIVDPSARGLGIGERLVEECIRFAAAKGYAKLVLWTNDILLAARHIYLAAGFKLIEEAPHHSFGKDLVGQSWELEL
jgi:DNA-binding MarR family transcriptional regulator/ribosomal protein S18 acetylase RimI-like enzyme